jgi:hypothetical protein
VLGVLLTFGALFILGLLLVLARCLNAGNYGFAGTLVEWRVASLFWARFEVLGY